MAVREIIILPDKRLRFVSEPVKRIDAGVRKLVEDMFETMYAAPGIGLAAIQVGVAKRVATLDLSKKEEAHEPQVFINPEITWASKEKSIHEEGCLSIPEYYEEVERPVLVKVKYLDLDGKTHEIEAAGLFATCLEHEIDHINGVLFIDHISKLKRDRACWPPSPDSVFAKFGWGRTLELGRLRRSLRRRRATGSSPRCGIERSAV
jgi:peptide deformylase